MLRAFKCLPFGCYQHWQDRLGLLLWRSEAVADVEICAEAARIQVTYCSESVGLRRGHLVFSLGWKSRLVNSLLVASECQCSHGQCYSSSFHRKYSKYFFFCVPFVTLNSCSFHVRPCCTLYYFSMTSDSSWERDEYTTFAAWDNSWKFVNLQESEAVFKNMYFYPTLLVLIHLLEFSKSSLNFLVFGADLHNLA